MTLRVHPEVCIESNWGLTGHIFKVEKQGPVLWHKNHSRCLLSPIGEKTLNKIMHR